MKKGSMLEADLKDQIAALAAQTTALEQVLQVLKTAVASSGLLAAGPGHLGFVPGGGLYVGAVADHVAAAFNAFSADANSSPAAAHIHQQVVQWLASMVGYDEQAWGD